MGADSHRVAERNLLSPHHPITPSPSVLDLVAALVEASLLRLETDPDGRTRYRMLETIREFAEERLVASGDAESFRTRHAAYFVAFAERYALAELLPDGGRVVAQLEGEQANLRASLAWLEEAGEAGSFLRLAATLGHFWAEQAHFQEGRDWLERALKQDGPAMDASRANALVALGFILLYQGANREAERRLTAGLSGCRELGDALHAAIALIGLGALAIMRDDHSGSASFLEEARTAAEAVVDRRLAGILAGRVSINLAVIARTKGDLALATECLEEALRLEREAGFTEGIILALGDLGDVARDQGDHPRAIELYREALGLGQGNPGTRVVNEAIEAAGIVAAAVGQAERGARLMGAAEAQRERLRLRYRVQETLVALEQAVTAAHAALGEPAFTAAWASGRHLTPGQAVAEALESSIAPAPATGVSMTPREMEILHLLASGLTDPAIAAALFVSVRTVENHVARIFAKLGVRTRTAAATAAIASGLIAPSLPTSA